MTPQTSLLAGVFAELFQSEKSATRHPVLEAERLGDSPPALPMQLVAAHATRALSELEVLTDQRHLSVGAAGVAVGRTFSILRDHFADLALRSEQSYRMTLVGIRHGSDLVRLLRELAIASDDTQLQHWCEQWLEERVQLIAQAEAQLSWFARFPEQAIRPVKETVWARAARSAAGALGKFDAALSRTRPKRA